MNEKINVLINFFKSKTTLQLNLDEVNAVVSHLEALKTPETKPEKKDTEPKKK